MGIRKVQSIDLLKFKPWLAVLQRPGFRSSLHTSFAALSLFRTVQSAIVLRGYVLRDTPAIRYSHVLADDLSSGIRRSVGALNIASWIITNPPSQISSTSSVPIQAIPIPLHREGAA
jgi:hypothetical protein